ncbi:hypothetical protein [Agromyces soli]|uniref:Uncharacterized protein n=1 Tax=Agromyces soli TaxID=659012 RepID=A0ABY4AZD4_9MICO|nr:hypothetical protein [Agromyces soli]UOE27126.1 hypothetical protein MTP13_04910 [Agromyces soli]
MPPASPTHAPSFTDPLAPELAGLDRRIEAVRATAVQTRALLDELPVLQLSLPLVGCVSWRSAAAEHYEARLEELVSRVGLARSALEQAELELSATLIRLEGERDQTLARLVAMAGAGAGAGPGPVSAETTWGWR